MILPLTIIFFVFGLIIGSFLNVVICRFNTSKSFGGRSVCLSCNEKICWYDNIPLISFFALNGKCRRCGSKFSWQYPAVELASGIIFALLFLKLQDSFWMDTIAFALSYAFYAVMFSILLVISVYDLKHKIIPDSLSLAFGVLAFAGLFLFYDYRFFIHWPSIWEFLSGVLLSAPFALIWLVSRGEWMGLGDAKLMLGLGWFLGLSAALSGALVAFWIGLAAGLALLFLNKKYSLKSEVPFAPFLVLGTIIAFFLELNLFSIYFQ